MHAARGVIGTFGGPAEAAGAVRVLLERGFTDVYAENGGSPRRSRSEGRRAGPAAMGTPRAALAGMAAGLLLAGLLSADWLPNGRARLLVSLSPGAEVALVTLVLFVLFGSLVNLAAVLTGCWAEAGGEVQAPGEGGRPFAVLAYGGDRDLAARILNEAGAQSVALGRRRLFHGAPGERGARGPSMAAPVRGPGGASLGPPPG